MTSYINCMICVYVRSCILREQRYFREFFGLLSVVIESRRTNSIAFCNVEHVELDPKTGLHCTLLLFANVTNIDEIHQKVMSGQLHCCVAKASLLVDAFQAIVAANKAVINVKQDRLTTKNVYTEILFCMSMSKNISRSLSEFGVGNSDKNILVILLHKLGEEQTTLADVLDTVKGDRIPVSRIQEFTNMNLVKKIYKIGEDELRISSLTDAVVSRISCKEFMLVR